MTKIAHLYHVDHLKQATIARELHVSQARVSRYLAKASDLGIVRTTVTVPSDMHLELESALEKKYGLDEAIVVSDEHGVPGHPSIAVAGARYLESTLSGTTVLGLATWSSTLLNTIENMRATGLHSVGKVAQLIGGVGSAHAQASALRMTLRLATLTGAQPVMLPAPGLVGSVDARNTLMNDPPVREALTLARQSDVALVSVGSLPPSRLIRESGNAMPDHVLSTLTDAGAVGDVCLQYFDHAGSPVSAGFSERVIGIDADSLLQIPRRVGVAGGRDKIEAIRGALTGGWLTVLVTDATVAMALLD
ncbi:MAG: sugar-binding transcriptional regulator [Leucobacter sp.]